MQGSFQISGVKHKLATDMTCRDKRKEYPLRKRTKPNIIKKINKSYYEKNKYNFAAYREEKKTDKKEKDCKNHEKKKGTETYKEKRREKSRKNYETKKDEINAKRREKYKKQHRQQNKTESKLDFIEFSAGDNMKKFHNSLKMVITQCNICKEAWPVSESSKMLKIEEYTCMRCKRDKNVPKKF